MAAVTICSEFGVQKKKKKKSVTILTGFKLGHAFLAIASWVSAFTWPSISAHIIGDKNSSFSPGVLVRINVLITHVIGLQQRAWSLVSDLEKSLRAQCRQEYWRQVFTLLLCYLFDSMAQQRNPSRQKAFPWHRE